MPLGQRKQLTGRGTAGKAVVVGAKERCTEQVSAQVVENTNKGTLQGFVERTASEDAKVYG